MQDLEKQAVRQPGQIKGDWKQSMQKWAKTKWESGGLAFRLFHWTSSLIALAGFPTIYYYFDGEWCTSDFATILLIYTLGYVLSRCFEAPALPTFDHPEWKNITGLLKIMVAMYAVLLFRKSGTAA